MKQVTRKVWMSFDGKDYTTEDECKLADVNEMLKRFVEDEGCYGMDKYDIANMLCLHKDVLVRILNGENLYTTDSEIADSNNETA